MRPFLTLLFSFFILFSYAQENFQPGYLVTPQHERIEGLIDYRDWTINPSQIQFKKNEQATAITYSANDVDEFGTEGHQYLGRIVKMDMSAVETSDVIKGIRPSETIMDTLFLEILAKGDPMLLTAIDKNEKRHFFYYKNENPAELILKKTLLIKKDQSGYTTATEVVSTESYKGQLKDLFKDCAAVADRVKAIRFSTKDLQSIFISYYQCQGIENKFSATIPRVKFHFGITGGMFFSKLKFDPVLTQFPENKFKAISMPFGFVLEAVLPKNRSRISIYNEVLFNRFAYEYTPTSTTEFVFSYWRINNMVRFTTLEKAKLNGFVNLGIGNGFAVKTEGEFPSYRKHEYALNGGIGLRLKRVALEGRYEITTGFSPYADVNDKSSSLYLLLSWRF